MSELETLQALERETGLLASRGDVEHMRQSSYSFTVQAASRLRREGWCLLKAPPGGNNINGVRIDKLINRHTLQMVDIIVNADDPNGPPRQASWQDVGIGDAANVVPSSEPGDPTPAPAPAPPPEPRPEADLEIETLISAVETMYTAVVQVTAVLLDVATQVAELKRDGIKLRLR